MNFGDLETDPINYEHEYKKLVKRFDALLTAANELVGNPIECAVGVSVETAIVLRWLNHSAPLVTEVKKLNADWHTEG